MDLPVNEPSLLEIIFRVLEWHATSVLTSPNSGISVERQARQDKIDSEHDECSGIDQEFCMSRCQNRTFASALMFVG